MVQLSPSSPAGDGKPHAERGLASLLSTAPPLQVYETYMENGFISLKHKIRNIEKKKVKLEDYRERLRNGENLNPDQLEAVEKYEEVVHNLDFAKELQKVFSSLSQDLLKAQKKSVRREQVQKTEAEKKRLRSVLEVQYLLQAFCQDHVQQDFKDGVNGAMYISSKELDGLSKFAKLVCHKRFPHMSLEDEMDQLSVYLWNLLEGNDKTVAGTNYKSLKDLVARMLDCGYFESVPDPPPEKPVILPEKPLKTETSPVSPTKADDQGVKSNMAGGGESSVVHVKSGPPSLQDQMTPAIRHCEPKIERSPQTTEMPKPVLVMKPWTGATAVKLQEQPKRWQSPLSLLPLTKPWETKSVPQPAVPQPKKCELEAPKERRERMPKPQPEVKVVTLLKDVKMPPVPSVQTAVKRRESPAPISIAHLSSSENGTQPHRVTSQPAAEFCFSPTLPKDPELRKQKLEDLIDEIKGTYNFMQDSMLDFEFPSPRAASPGLVIEVPTVPSETIEGLKDLIVPTEKVSTSPLSTEPSVDPVCPVPSEPEDLPTPVCSPIKVPISPAHKVEVLVSAPVSAPIYVPIAQLPEALPERSPTPVPLQTEPLQSPKTPTNVPLLRPKREGTPLSARSTPTSTHTSPFQGMQAVFKVSPPLPARKEIDIKEEPLYPLEYQQTYSTASTQTLPHGLLDQNSGDLPSFIPEPLVGGHYPGIPPVSNGSMPVYTSTPNLLPRIPQQCMGTRGGILRGTSRGARLMTNGYRCQTSFKGPETYRGTQCPPNGSFGHAPCPGRDYTIAQFIPRDATSHLCHKRGSVAPVSRSTSRSWSDSSQLGNPEMEESFNSTDSGQGDSRSMTPVDVSMSSGQAATILPVHVYPLPQQMRVAFSSARTSNFAPGTLDQPIVFDLLLNNLGDTFDFQVGRFMCPVNGTYVFIFHMLKLAVNVPLYVNLMKNEEVMVSAYANDGAPDHETASNHAVLQLYQGDQIWLRLHRGAIYGSSWKYSTFSGYLLYQD
ncbi:caprin-2 [Ranitomeya imitator]|uniref:caprin-2 n=1 Tax=Ranitomeya imitator TaxID=111125 RepID=UPI0037E7AC03